MHLNASRLSRALRQPTTHPSNMHLNKRGHTDLNLHPSITATLQRPPRKGNDSAPISCPRLR